MNRVSDALDSFRCALDKDIENFLRFRAISYIERGWCAVYLMIDEQEFDEGRIKIEAYFTLSHKPLIPPEDLPKSKIKDASGFKDSESIHFVLIGQLGKRIDQLKDGRYDSSVISSHNILDDAFSITEKSSALIPCRCALVECSDNEKVHKVYQDYGFKFFQFDGDHYQFYRRI